MQRRTFLRHAAGAAAASLVGAMPPPRPDLVVILADDLAPDGIGAWGSPEVKTPNLDRLVRRGMSFTQAYIQGSWTGAVCIASRTMLMTGLPVWRAEQGAAGVAAAGRTWPQRLRAAGYRTAFTGKWHIPAMKPEAVFSEGLRPTSGMPKDSPAWYRRPVEGQSDPFRPWDETLGGYWEGGRHWSEQQADDGIELLRGTASDARPFFLYQAFNAPHDPRQSPRPYCDMYPPGSVSLPPSFQPAHPDADALGAGPSLRDEALAPSPRTPFAVETHRREYYAIITHLDAQIGRLLDAIEATGRPTWIFFSSDNGLAIGRHGLMGKQNMYGHSARVPLVVAGPGVPAGSRCAAPVYMQDVMATTLDLAGLPPDDAIAWRSLRPFFSDPTRIGRTALYSAYRNRQRMVFDGEWKLILYPTIPRASLFRVAEDPDELCDRAAEPGSAPVIRRLFRRLRELQKETGDALDLEAAFPSLSAG